MYLSKNIRYLRRHAGLSQEQVAQRLGYNNFTTVQKWESGKSDPPIKVVASIASLFRVNIDDLVTKDLENETAISVAELTDGEATLLRVFRELSQEGKDKLLERCAELKQLDYKKGYQSFRSDTA